MHYHLFWPFILFFMTTIKPIAQLGNPVLRAIASVIHDICTQTELMQALTDTLASTEGVGIAAPQISESKRVIIVASRPNTRYPHAPQMPPTLMFNPEFEPLGKARQIAFEGCLSVPSLRAQVPRYTKILAQYLDEQGIAQQVILTDFVARIFQHEVDHLNGIVYLDRVESSRAIISESEYFKRLGAGHWTVPQRLFA